MNFINYGPASLFLAAALAWASSTIGMVAHDGLKAAHKDEFMKLCQCEQQQTSNCSAKGDRLDKEKVNDQ